MITQYAQIGTEKIPFQADFLTTILIIQYNIQSAIMLTI